MLLPDCATPRTRQLIDGNLLVPWFQPLARLQDGSVYGFQSLVRGPAESEFSTPAQLFELARSEGCVLALELHACKVALREFVRGRRSGKLVMNMSARGIIAATVGRSGGDLLGAAQRFGLLSSRIILKLAEEQRVCDLPGLREALAALRKAGVELALDDFGDGHSSLRMWTELRPGLVKIDRFFVRGLHADHDKFQALQALRNIAEAFGGMLLADGIEEEADLVVLRDMGVELGQGELIGPPQPRPAARLPQEVLAALRSRKIAVFPEIRQTARKGVTAAALVVEAPPVAPQTSNDELVRLFRERPALHAVAVVQGSRPVGLINRQGFMDRYAQPYHKEIYGRRSCALFMNAAPLVIERDTPLLDLVDVLRGEDQRYLVDGFVIAHEGRYVGLGTGERLVRGVSELRIEAARHANPLTALPGNIPISEHIERLLAARVDFVACYCDLNHFKPYNDYYGYWRGDEVLRLVAGLVVAHCDPLRDFVGHVGGDDFVLLLQSEDWRERCARIIAEFGQRVESLYDEAARRRGGIEAENRQGQRCFFPFTALVIGTVMVRPGEYCRAEDVASAAACAKRAAKAEPGGLIVCNRDSAGIADFLCSPAEGAAYSCAEPSRRPGLPQQHELPLQAGPAPLAPAPGPSGGASCAAPQRNPIQLA